MDYSIPVPVDCKVFYERKSHNFWFGVKDKWTCVCKDSLVLLLKELGLSAVAGTALVEEGSPRRNNLSQIDDLICKVIRTQHVDFSVNVAGHKPGVYDMYGKKVLVQDGPKLLTLSKGEFPFIEKFLVAVSRVHPIQYHVLKSWLKLGLQRIYNHSYSYHQVLFEAGDVASGKSFFHMLITVCVGGRVANAEDWLLGNQAFNRDLHENEHVCNEEPTVLSFRDIQKYINGIKTMAVVEGKRCRGLYAEAVTLCPIQMVSVSTNLEYKNISVIPADEPGIEDKFHSVLFPDNTMPLEGYENLGHKQIRAIVEKEAPHLIWHLFEEYEVPAELLTRVKGPRRDCARFGMDAYHNPEIVQMINEMSVDLTCLAVLERLANINSIPIQGTAAYLANWMRAKSDDPDAVELGKDARKLGYTMRSLAKKFPKRVKKLKEVRQGTVWTYVKDSEASQTSI